MHEYSIVGSLIERVAAEAKSRGARRIDRIEVRIGELAGVDVELLQTAYNTFREGSICAEAPLSVSAVPALWECPQCATPIARGAVLRCPKCQTPARLSGGDEIILERIEMEVS